mmetsp:Transcript_1131/g.3878  ORF Transcript_1131/g.3878 Transcript_1131/m.3878 type:complete len:348 (-) Transcript_1131:4117-5160(-)
MSSSFCVSSTFSLFRLSLWLICLAVTLSFLSTFSNLFKAPKSSRLNQHATYQTFQDLQLYNSIDWHDENGEVSVIHHMNEVRVAFIEAYLVRRQDSTRIPRILDLGCGSGIASLELIGANAGMLHQNDIHRSVRKMHITCVDIANGALEQGRAKSNLLLDLITTTLANSSLSQQDSTRLQTIKYNLQHLSFLEISVYDLLQTHAPNSFDLIIASNVLNYFENLPLAVETIANLLDKGGYMYYDGFTRNYLSWLLISFVQFMEWVPARTFDWHMFVRPSELDVLFEENHLTTLELKNIVPTMWPLWSVVQFLHGSLKGGFIARLPYMLVERAKFEGLEFMYAGISEKR